MCFSHCSGRILVISSLQCCFSSLRSSHSISDGLRSGLFSFSAILLQICCFAALGSLSCCIMEFQPSISSQTDGLTLDSGLWCSLAGLVAVNTPKPSPLHLKGQCQFFLYSTFSTAHAVQNAKQPKMELNKENAQQWWNKNVKKIELQDKTIKKTKNNND